MRAGAIFVYDGSTAQIGGRTGFSGNNAAGTGGKRASCLALEQNVPLYCQENGQRTGEGEVATSLWEIEGHWDVVDWLKAFKLLSGKCQVW